MRKLLGDYQSDRSKWIDIAFVLDGNEIEIYAKRRKIRMTKDQFAALLKQINGKFPRYAPHHN